MGNNCLTLRNKGQNSLWTGKHNKDTHKRDARDIKYMDFSKTNNITLLTPPPPKKNPLLKKWNENGLEKVVGFFFNRKLIKGKQKVILFSKCTEVTSAVPSLRLVLWLVLFNILTSVLVKSNLQTSACSYVFQVVKCCYNCKGFMTSK